MQEFYRAIHAIVGELMEARNMFIALYGLGDGIALEPQGELLMKGKTEPTKVYAVLADAVVAETA